MQILIFILFLMIYTISDFIFLYFSYFGDFGILGVGGRGGAMLIQKLDANGLIHIWRDGFIFATSRACAHAHPVSTPAPLSGDRAAQDSARRADTALPGGVLDKCP